MNILIIDGYNIIKQWADLKKELKRSGFEYTRNKLIEILAEYQAFTGDRVIVVFDGYKTDKKLITKSSQFGVEVIFSKRKQTADSLIERLVYNERGEGKTIFVATRDTALERMIFGMDCLTISPQKLEERINAVKLEIKGYL
ncbi:MAG: NYN domain-containing protein [bacterium]